MSWPRDAMLREQHPFLVATTSYVEGTTYQPSDHSKPGLSEMDSVIFYFELRN